MPRRKLKVLGNWRDKAECLNVPLPLSERVNLFYPERSHVEAAKAKAVCKTCSVRQECLDEAIQNGERFGVWGGMDTQERGRETRRRMREKR